jgi:predicted transposase/invertase (TIGR01784 family)
MASRYINPFTDFGFKRLFGEEVNKDLLIDFLNGLLPEHHKIKDLTYSRNEHLGDLSIDGRAVFDIYCQSLNGDRFIVELQKAKQNFFKDRSVYYATFPIREQAERGDWNFELKAVYCVGILDFVFEEDAHNPDYLHTVQLKNKLNQVFYDKLSFIYIEMPKFNKTDEELESGFDRWLFFIKNLENFNYIPDRLRNKIFEKAFQAAEIAKFDPNQLQAYESSLKYYRDIKNVVDTSFEEGKLEGIEEGMMKAKIEIAKQLLLAGTTVDQVSTLTGLTIQELEGLN